MKKAVVAALSVLSLTGCASSGPVPIGKDTYMISKQSAGGAFVAASSVKADVFREANEFCNSQGKTFQVVGTNQVEALIGSRMPSAEVQFMCLDSHDAELKRPKLRKEADSVIEIRK
ncbi:MAG: hypothetical protein Q8O38_09990 [Sulfurimicrobium sp.]|nr:hypothetical protein [Sulfurimicrobium sp.]